MPPTPTPTLLGATLSLGLLSKFLGVLELILSLKKLHTLH